MLEFQVRLFFLNEDNFRTDREGAALQNHMLSLKCRANDDLCEGNNFLVIYPEDDYQVIKIEITIYKTFNQYIQINGINFYAKTIDKNFIQFLLLLRLVCLVVSTIFGISYLMFLQKIPRVLRTFEHEYIAVLSIFLVFFNNPFYGFALIHNNLLSILVGNILVISFLSLVIFFWYLMMQRIHKETIMIGTNLVNKKNKAIFLVIYLLLLFYSLAINLLSKYYPGLHLDSEFPKLYIAYQVSCLVVSTIILSLIIYGMFKVYRNWNKIIPRHKFFFIFSLYFILIFFLLILSFFSDLNARNGLEILMFFILNNFYVIMLQQLWKFSMKGAIELEDYNNEIEKLNKSQGEKSILGKSYFDDDYDIKIYRKSKGQRDQKGNDSSQKEIFEIKKNTVLSVSSFNISDNSSTYKNDNSAFNESHSSSDIKKVSNHLNKSSLSNEQDLSREFANLEEKELFSSKILVDHCPDEKKN